MFFFLGANLIDADAQLDRMSSITSKYLGRPFTQAPAVLPTSVPLLDLSVGGGLGGGPSLDLDLLSGCSSGMLPPVTEMERPMMIDLAARAMDELIRLAQAGRQLWVKGVPGDALDTLNVAAYDSLFAAPGGAFRPPDISVEGSRDSGLVFMSAVALVDVFMDTVHIQLPPLHVLPSVVLRSVCSHLWRAILMIHCCCCCVVDLLLQNKWTEFFPGIVSKAHTGDVLMSGLCGRSESLIMVTLPSNRISGWNVSPDHCKILSTNGGAMSSRRCTRSCTS
jgi:homeobox-leucine zipper protein